MAVNSRSDNGERRGDWSWEDDDRAYEERLPELMVKYEGRYVAMFRGEVIGVADSAREAATKGLETLGRSCSSSLESVSHCSNPWRQTCGSMPRGRS
ncbi:MAG TPA: hypothetical protein DEP45_03205 [Armatimonadetes bacterium]|nr:hypothetical protein [Armatimonadota bacterium]